MVTRESRVKTAAMLCAVAIFGALATNVSFAEQNDRQAPATGAIESSAAGTIVTDTARKDAGGGDRRDGQRNGRDAANAATSPTSSAVAPGEQTSPSNGGRWQHGTGGPGADSGRRGANAGPSINPPTTGQVTKGVGEHGIDLVRPDDGYASLRRRAIRKSLIANSAKKTIIPYTNPAARPQGSSLAAVSDPVRNAVGVASANGVNFPQSDKGHRPTTFPAHGNAGTPVADAHASTTLHANPAGHVPGPGTGINGSNYGRLASGPGIVGGPAKIRTGVNGTSIRPRF